jgi:phosphohistidine phosphatase
MMKIYILRHGEAVDAEEVGGGDAARTLTAKGEKTSREAARGMLKLEIRPEAIWTSPYPRAAQTARLTAETLGFKGRCEPLAALEPGADPAAVAGLLEADFKNEAIMIVGHNPDLEDLIQYLISESGQARVALKKGGLALVEADRPPRQGSATLVGLFTPRQLARLAG